MKKLAWLLLVATILFSCGTQQQFAGSPRYRHGGGSDALHYFSATDFEKEKDRVVIYNAKVNVLVENADSLNVALVRLAKNNDGYAITLGNRSSSSA